MTWVDLKTKAERKDRCRCSKKPTLWPWSNIDFASVWQCDRCSKKWIVAGQIEGVRYHRFWSTNIHLWESVSG